MATLKMFSTIVDDEEELNLIKTYSEAKMLSNFVQTKNQKIYKFNYERDYEYLHLYEKPINNN